MLRQNLQRMFARFFSRVSVQGAAVAVSSASGAQLAVGGALLGASLYSLRARQASCSDAVHPPELPWSHKGPLDAFDTASIRRGLQVYQQVCAACHSLTAIAFRELAGVTHDVDGVKALAAKYDIKDGPNDMVRRGEKNGPLLDARPCST